MQLEIQEKLSTVNTNDEKVSGDHGDYYRVIPWLFETTHTKLNKDKLFDKEYRNSDHTKLKTR